MAKMMAIYREPKDIEAFRRHYFDVHIPLAKTLPGLRRYEVSQGEIAALSPGRPPFLVGSLYFDSLADIRAAFASEAGAACAADRRLFAPTDEDVTILLFDDAPV